MSQFADDQVLIERAQKGDRDALDQLIRKYEKRAYQYAYRLTSNSEEACDVVGDAFVRIYSAMRNFKGNSAFTTWMYRILTNCFLDLRKRDRNRPSVSLEAAMQTEDGIVERQFESDEPTADLIAERNQREATIEHAVSLLPEYQRAMVTLYHAENLSYEEIAEALDLPIGTVKSRLNRARLSLREQLVRDEELFNLG
jgi:RNA polymerase sigma-70 factor (ECF subfamily)